MDTTNFQTVQKQLRENPRKWLVTGAAGFIGSHLVEKLLQLGQTVIGLDNLITGNMANLQEVRKAVEKNAWTRFSFIEGDICHLDQCQRACAGVDFVLHQAALGSVPRSLADPLQSHRANVDGFINMLIAARDAKVRRFVYASSSSVYGDDKNLPKTEARSGSPLSPYAATKLIDEIYAGVFSRCYGLPTVGLRYFNVFGPRQDPNGPYAAVIPLWFRGLLSGGDIQINGDGSTSRDFCYVVNVVQANILSAVCGQDDGSTILNIAVGQKTTLLDLLQLIKSTLQDNDKYDGTKVVHSPERNGDVRHSLADISMAKKVIGYNPTHDIKRGIAETSMWYRQAR